MIAGAPTLARIACREILLAGHGLPWLGAIAAAGWIARRSAAVDAGATPWLRASLFLGAGIAAALAVAAFAPIALAGRSRGRTVAPLVASRPLSPLARAAGPAVGAALAAVAVAAAFLALAPLVGATAGGEMRLVIAELAPSRALLAEDGDATEASGDAPAGAQLRLAPRLGFASGLGDPHVVRLRVEIESGGGPAAARALELRGRETATLELPAAGAMRVRVAKLEGDVPARWPAGSIALVRPALGAWSFAARMLASVAVAALALAAVASALAASLDRPIAALAAGSVALVALAAPSPWLRDALGLSAIVDSGAWSAREIAAFDAAAAARTLAVAAAAIAWSALVRARRP